MRVLIAAGGSGGHIFPAIALYRSLKELKRDIDIIFVGSSRALDKRIFAKEGARYFLLSDNKLPGRFSLGFIPFCLKSVSDMVRTLKLFCWFKPDVVVGFGGYVSFPAVVMAKLFRRPKLIHEQNVVCGRANAFMLPWADKIALSFDETRESLGKNLIRAVFTGNPIRGEILKAEKNDCLKRLGFDQAKFTILVIGGSQGAHTLNKKFIESISLMDAKTLSSLQIIHITGLKDYRWALEKYSSYSSLTSRIFSFVDRIEEAYAAADLVVTRSGSSALFELAALGKAMILVPYPYAMSHQSENARVFSGRGAAVLIEEKDLSAGVFKDNILQLFNNRAKLDDMERASRQSGAPKASENLAREVVSIGEKIL